MAEQTNPFADLTKMAQNYGQSGGYAQGDMDGDGRVGFSDMVMVSQNYGDSMGGLAAPVAAPVAGAAVGAVESSAAVVSATPAKAKAESSPVLHETVRTVGRPAKAFSNKRI